MFEEHRNVFRSPTRHQRVFNPYSRQAAPKLWSHNFLCLASRFTMQVPKTDYKQLLTRAGLGEKRVSIDLNADADKLQEKLLIVFPQLYNAGGYDLLRCLPNSRMLSMLQPPQGGFTPAYLKQEVGGARIYIRPIRQDLLLNDEVSS